MEAKRAFDHAHKKQAPKLDRYGRQKKDKPADFAQWVIDSIQKLVASGHRMADIADYPLDKVVTLLHALDRVETRNRLIYISDMSMILGGMFGGGSDLSKHIDDLNEVVTGE
jgi:hypothetical protein